MSLLFIIIKHCGNWQRGGSAGVASGKAVGHFWKHDFIVLSPVLFPDSCYDI